MEYERNFPLTAPYRACGVSFEVDGGELLGARLPGPNPQKARTFWRFGRWVGIRFDAPVDEDQTLEVDLRLLGSPEDHVAIQLKPIQWIPLPNDQALLAQGTKWVNELDDYLVKLSDGAAGDRIKKLARSYFSRLDNVTMSAVDPAVAPVISGLLATLKARILARGAGNNETPPNDHSLEAIKRISNLMLSTMEAVFGAPLEDADRLSTIGEAHDIFAWGGLHIRETAGIAVSNTVPDGANIFLFPEFAHLAIEGGADAHQWRALLPALTRMPALYLYAHERAREEKYKRIPRAFAEYAFPPIVSAKRSEMVQHAAELAKSYGAMGVAELGAELGKTARRAFNECNGNGEAA